MRGNIKDWEEMKPNCTEGQLKDTDKETGWRGNNKGVEKKK